MVVERFPVWPGRRTCCASGCQASACRVPELHPTRPSQGADREAWDAEDWLKLMEATSDAMGRPCCVVETTLSRRCRRCRSCCRRSRSCETRPAWVVCRAPRREDAMSGRGSRTKKPRSKRLGTGSWRLDQLVEILAGKVANPFAKSGIEGEIEPDKAPILGARSAGLRRHRQPVLRRNVCD